MTNNQIPDAEVSERGQDADALNESRSDRRGHERTGSKPAHRDAGNKSSAIREPFH